MPQRDPLPGKALSRFDCGTCLCVALRRVTEGKRSHKETHQVAEKAVAVATQAIDSDESPANNSPPAYKNAGEQEDESLSTFTSGEVFCLTLLSILASNCLPDTHKRPIPTDKSLISTLAIGESASRQFSVNLSDSPH